MKAIMIKKMFLLIIFVGVVMQVFGYRVYRNDIVTMEVFADDGRRITPICKLIEVIEEGSQYEVWEEKGRLLFEFWDAGEYTFEISAIGCSAQRISITVLEEDRGEVVVLPSMVLLTGLRGIILVRNEQKKENVFFISCKLLSCVLPEKRILSVS